MSDTTFSPFITMSSTSFSPIVMYNGMSLVVETMRVCQCDTPLAMTKPMAVADESRMYACTSWCPFCGATKHVTTNFKMFPNTAPADVWRLDADKIYEFVSRINDLGYLPKRAGSNDLAWTFPQMYSDGTFSTNVFNIAVGRGLTVRAPECYILRDEQLTVFDTKLLNEFDQLGILGLMFPKEPAHANA